uniref:Uncharacterized protein n=1 Tax=Sphaerodactylus townsendi TaxID=933632 RepID=A0ACB8FRN2_9SAUR
MSNDSEEKNTSVLSVHNQECHVDSEFRYTLFTAYYSIIFILGFVSNTYVLWIFSRVYATKKLNEIKIFMINLTTADLLFLVTLPMWIVYYHHKGDWIMPNFLCNVGGYLFFVNTYCSVAFLGVITYNRFQAVTKPITAAQSTTRRRGIYVTLAIWVLIAVPAIYFLVDDGTTDEVVKGRSFRRCFERYDTTGDISPVLGFHVVICVCFFITFLVVLVCNAFIIRTLLSQPVQARKSARVRQRALWMAWKISCRTQQMVNDLHQVTLLLLGANCVLDPVIYCFLTKKFRKHLSENLKNIKDSRKCSRQTTETGVDGMVPLESCKQNSIKP